MVRVKQGRCTRHSAEVQGLKTLRHPPATPFGMVDDIIVLASDGWGMVVTMLAVVEHRQPHLDVRLIAADLGLYGIHRAEDGDFFIRLS